MTSLRLLAVASTVCTVAAVALSGCASITRTVGGERRVTPTQSAPASAPASVPPTPPAQSPGPVAASASPSVAASQVRTCVVGKWRLVAWLEVVDASTWDSKATGAVTIQASDEKGSLGTLTLGEDGHGSQTLNVVLAGDTDSHSYAAAFHGTATFTYTVSNSAAGPTMTYARKSGSFTAELSYDHVAVREVPVPLSTNPYVLSCTGKTLTLRATNYAYAFARS